MTTRDELADTLMRADPHYPAVMARELYEHMADVILARWRLVPVEEQHRAADELTRHDQTAGHYGVVYESRKGALLGPGSGITTAEQARAVSDALRGRRTDQHEPHDD